MSLDLDAIKARCDATTPGPWEARLSYDDIEEVGELWWVEHDGWIDGGDGLFASRSDAEFIAAARTDVPALVAEVERLRAENAALAHGLTVAVESMP